MLFVDLTPLLLGWVPVLERSYLWQRQKHAEFNLRGPHVLHACAVQGEELEPARAKAEKMGIKQIFIEDVREEFVRDYVFPMF
eukprot:scaffold12051_cov20-Tisochrysis_lutea.AAC.2